MNKITLAFKKQDLEEFYRKQQHKKELQLLKTNFWLILIFFCAITINNFINNEFFKGGLQLTMLVFFIIFFILSHQSYQIMDYGCLLFSLYMNGFMCYLVYYGSLTTQNNHDQALYLNGVAHSFILIGQLVHQFNHNRFFIGTRFIIKIMNLVSQLLILTGFQIVHDDIFFEPYKLLYLASFVLITTYLYKNEKQKKDLFLMKNQQEQWQEVIKYDLDFCLFQCHLNKQTRQIDLIQYNEYAGQTFTFRDKSLFRSLLRQCLTLKTNLDKLWFLDQPNVNKLSKKLRGKGQHLEKVIYLLLKYPEKFLQYMDYSKLINIYQQKFKLFCFHDSKLYKVTLFTTYQNQREVMLIIQPDIYQEEMLDSYKERYNQLIQKKQTNYLSMLAKPFLQQFQIISNNPHLKEKQTQIAANFYLFYNNQLNLQLLQWKNLNSIISEFSLQEVINNTLEIIQPLIQLRKQKIILTNLISRDCDKIRSQKWMINHILLNLLINCIQHSPSQTIIRLEVITKWNSFIKQFITVFKLYDQHEWSKDKIKLVKFNSEKDSQYYSYFIKQNQLKLGFYIAEMLLQKIGFDGHLRNQKSKQNQDFTRFSILNNVNSMHGLNRK